MSTQAMPLVSLVSPSESVKQRLMPLGPLKYLRPHPIKSSLRPSITPDILGAGYSRLPAKRFHNMSATEVIELTSIKSGVGVRAAGTGIGTGSGSGSGAENDEFSVVNSRRPGNQAHIQSSAKAAWVITILTGVTFVGCISTGLVTIALPAIARDLDIPPHLLLW